MSEVKGIKPPMAFLGDLAVDEVPVYLQALARAGRMIVGVAIYGNEGDRVRAAQILERVEAELEQAREDIKAGGAGDDGVDGTG